MILYSRIEKLNKENEDMFDLCMLNVKNDGLKFIQRVLGFFNFNFKQSFSDHKCKVKIEKLIKTVPSLSQMKKVLRKYKTTEKEKLIFKVVIDLMEAYYKEYDGPLYKRYTKKLIPLAKELYK